MVTPDGTSFPFKASNGLFYIAVHRVQGSSHFVSKRDSLELWHQRMGHNNSQDLLALQKSVTGLEIERTEPKDCDVCIASKAKREFKVTLPEKRRGGNWI